MPDEPAPTGTTLAAADGSFGADVYGLLSEQRPDLVFSPVSVAGVLRMALCGACGQTGAELAGGLPLFLGQVSHPRSRA